MGKEIERKFLVNNNFYPSDSLESHRLIQTYLSVTPESTVRVRIKDNEAFITVKSKNIGAQRNEWEYSIPIAEAYEIIEKCAQTPIIDKTRYINGRWEIDVFHRSLDGLILAEIELQSEDENIDIPNFIGQEVTNDTRYYNSVLAVKGNPK